MVDDPRIAALAEALTDLFPAVQRDWWPFTSEQAAAAILAALAHCERSWEDAGKEIATLRAALDGLREPLGEWLIEMMERNLTPAEATLYAALRSALAAAKETP